MPPEKLGAADGPKAVKVRIEIPFRSDPTIYALIDGTTRSIGINDMSDEVVDIVREVIIKTLIAFEKGDASIKLNVVKGKIERDQSYTLPPGRTFKSDPPFPPAPSDG